MPHQPAVTLTEEERSPNEAGLRRQVLMVESERNHQQCGIAWQFTSPDARRKLEWLYLVKEPASD